MKHPDVSLLVTVVTGEHDSWHPAWFGVASVSWTYHRTYNTVLQECGKTHGTWLSTMNWFKTGLTAGAYAYWT